MSDIRKARERLATRILEGAGQAPHSERRAAFNNRGLGGSLGVLADKVARRPSTVTDADIAAARLGGISEDHIFEIVVCAAIGQAARQYEAALTAIEAAIAAPAGKE